jgi:ribonuclease Y
MRGLEPPITLLVLVLACLAALALGAAIGFVVRKLVSEAKIKSAEAHADQLIAGAQAQSSEMILKAKDESIRVREEAAQEARRQQQELRKEEERLRSRQTNIDQRFDKIEQRERKLNQRQSLLDQREQALETLEEEKRQALERVSGLSAEDAKELLLDSVREEYRDDMARVIREVEADAEAEADRRAQKIITVAIGRLASDQVAETTVASVPLPSDEMKGRIIGRQGRNIRAIESVTGADLVVDDTPEAITISCFDPIRREVARMLLTRLVQDGRIHPARIEKEAEEAREEVERIIREEGDRAALEIGVPNLHKELLKLVGSLKFRTSYGQNQLLHSLETAHLAGLMAAELRADVQLAKVGGLLHDIGKAVSHEDSGPHALVGADLARRYGMTPQVVNCVAAHHYEEDPLTVEAVLVAAADALSGARPGARRESLESYIKRITALEEIAGSFEGVDEAYAIQAGREIRIIVKPEELDDLAIIELSRGIADKVEQNLQYPGQIKVTVIRETRAVDYAR